MAQDGNGQLAPTEPTAVTAAEKVLDPREALHSIAVELARHNKLTAQSVQLQLTQLQLTQNILDILRAQTVGVSAKLEEQRSGAIQLVERFLEPLIAMATQNIAKPPQITSEPTPPKPVVAESGGTRIEAEPPSE